MVLCLVIAAIIGILIGFYIGKGFSPDRSLSYNTVTAHGGAAASRAEAGLYASGEAGVDAFACAGCCAGGCAFERRDGGRACRSGDTAEAGGNARRAGLAERADAIGSGRRARGGRAAADGRGPTGQGSSAALGGKHGPAASRRAAGKHHAASGEARANGRACAELRPARNDAVGDTGAEDAEAKQRQRGEHNRHGVVDGRGRPAETGRELREQRRADADDDRQHQNLDAGRYYVPQDLLGHERGLAEQPEGDEDEAGERHQFELDQGDE